MSEKKHDVAKSLAEMRKDEKEAMKKKGLKLKAVVEIHVFEKHTMLGVIGMTNDIMKGLAEAFHENPDFRRMVEASIMVEKLAILSCGGRGKEAPKKKAKKVVKKK